MKGTSGIVQFVRFNIMGVAHVVVFSIVLFVSKFLGFSNFLAGAFGYISVLIFGSIGNIFYVFRSLREKKTFWKYFIGNALVYISSVSLELFTTHEFVPYLESQGFSNIFIILFQYTIYGFGGMYVFLVNRYVVFRKKEE